MGSKKKSISSVLFISFLLVVLLSLVIQTVFWVSSIYMMSSVQKEQREQQYLEANKDIIKHEVDHVVEIIADVRKKTEQQLKAEIEKQVTVAYAIASNIYDRNVEHKSNADIQQMILHAIVPPLTADTQKIAIAGSVSGEIFFAQNNIGTGSGIPIAHELLRKSSEAIAAGSDDYSSWQTQYASSGKQAESNVFVKYFKNANLIIAAGFYYKDLTTVAKEEALKQISSMRYGAGGEGYFYAFQYDGVYLSHIMPKYISLNLISITDPNGVLINKEIVKKCKSGGGFVTYVWDRYKIGKLIDKISYVKGYDPWQWAIGTGFYLDDLQEAIQAQENTLQEQLESFLLKIALISVLIFLLSIIVIKLILRKLNAELAIFESFFTDSAAKSRKISLQDVHYTEFQHLAEHANTMLTDRKMAETALSQSEERFRHLVADLPQIAVQGYDRERNVVYWNHASETLYGYSEDEALGNKLEDLIVPTEMREQVVRAISDWYKHDVAVPSGELILRHKDGSAVPVYSFHVMLGSGQGEKEMYCVDLDLAELRLAQEKELKSESFYRQLFDHSSNGVAVYEAVDNGQDFIFKDFNKAGEKMDGISRNILLGKKVTEAFPGVEEFGLLDVFRKVWQTGEPAFHPVTYYQDGHLQGWRENRVYKLPTGEIVVVYDDITRQKQLEHEKLLVERRLQQAQKMEAIGLMAGGVAHDLNNILTGITGYPELLLLRLPEESDLRQPIEAIKESGKRATAIVSDLLTVARGVASSRVAANLNTMVTDYLASPEWRQLHSLHQSIICDKRLVENVPNISCSPVHIRKCIMNLVTNAVEAIDQAGSITLSTSTFTPDLQWAEQNELEQKEYVVLTVDDTGTGIPDENIEHIFEPFYTRKVMGRSGTGLGLAVVWNTMEDHSGKIIVKSSENGTRFQLYFPASDENCAVQTQDKDSSERKQLMGSGEHILVVDDEAQLRDVACQMLQISGYRVDSVASGEQAIEFMKEKSVDLLVMDMLMDPGMNGYQTYKEILKQYPAQKAIIVSGFSESDAVKAALALGAAGFVKKPYSLDIIAKAVRDAIKSVE